MGPQRVLPLQVRGVSIKEYSTLTKSPGLEPHNQMQSRGSYLSAAMKSAYSTAPTDWDKTDR